MENWQKHTTFFIWATYILIIVLLVGFLVAYLIRTIFVQKIKQKKELTLLREKHITELLGKHIQTQEYERKRIGVDLHDVISNRLNMILLKLRVSNVKKDMEEDLNETINAVRRLAHNLNPPMIDKIPIDILIRSQFDTLTTEYKIQIWSKSLNKTIWKTDCKIQIIRIIQELITNIVKHSKAKHIHVKIRERNRNLFISVEDDGIGFSTENKGMGLKNIENRLFIVGGSFKIKSAENRGTKVIIALHNEI